MAESAMAELILMMLPKKHRAELHDHRIVAHGFHYPSRNLLARQHYRDPPPGLRLEAAARQMRC